MERATTREDEDVNWLLRFEPPSLEAEFQEETSRRRILSTYRVDAALFSVLALFMACGWPRDYNKGHPREMAYMLLSGIVYTVCACLYTFRAKPDSLMELVQIKLRLGLQVLCYSMASILFSRHIGLENMGLCSPINADFSAFEALLVYLMWMASYPTIASIPLKYAVIIQPILFLFVHEPSKRECLMGDECPRTDDMYALYTSKLAWLVGSTVPMTAGGPARAAGSLAYRSCMMTMLFWKLFIVVFFSLLIKHHLESRVRRLYILEFRKGTRMVKGMNSKQTEGKQLLVELMMCMAMTWLVAELIVE